MIGNFGIDGTDPADVVRHFAEVGPEFAEVHSAVPVLPEGIRRFISSPVLRSAENGCSLPAVTDQD